MSCTYCARMARKLMDENGCSGFQATEEFERILATFIRDPSDSRMGNSIGKRSVFFLTMHLVKTLKEESDDDEVANTVLEYYTKIIETAQRNISSNVFDYLSNSSDEDILLNLYRYTDKNFNIDYQRIHDAKKEIKGIEDTFNKIFSKNDHASPAYKRMLSRFTEAISNTHMNYNLRHLNKIIIESKQELKDIWANNKLSTEPYYDLPQIKKETIKLLSKMSKAYMEIERRHPYETQVSIENHINEIMPYLSIAPDSFDLLSKKLCNTYDIEYIK